MIWFAVAGWGTMSAQELIISSLMSTFLRIGALGLPLGALACLALPADQQLPAAAALSLLGGAVIFWLTVRASLLGDRLAPVMALGCLFTLPAIAGLYAVALHLPLGLWAQALLALCAVLSNMLTGRALWQRDRHHSKNWRVDVTASQLDPVTRLYSGGALVLRLVKALRRRRRRRQ
jgi:hypothetical protein